MPQHQAKYRAGVLATLSRRRGEHGDARPLARHVATLGTIGAAAAGMATAAAAAAPAAAQAKSGLFCNTAGTGVVLYNPSRNGEQWTCIRWQQNYDVSFIGTEWSTSPPVCAGVTLSGNANPRHISDMPDILGYVCGTHTAVCSTQCDGYSGHPFVKNAGGAQALSTFQGVIVYH